MKMLWKELSRWKNEEISDALFNSASHKFFCFVHCEMLDFLLESPSKDDNKSLLIPMREWIERRNSMEQDTTLRWLNDLLEFLSWQLCLLVFMWRKRRLGTSNVGACWTKIKLNLVSSFIKLVVSCHLKCTVYCEVYWIISSILSEKAGRIRCGESSDEAVWL